MEVKRLVETSVFDPKWMTGGPRDPWHVFRPPLDQTILQGWWRCVVMAIKRINDVDSARGWQAPLGGGGRQATLPS